MKVLKFTGVFLCLGPAAPELHLFLTAGAGPRVRASVNSIRDVLDMCYTFLYNECRSPKKKEANNG